VANITSVDTCTGTPISKGVSSHMTEYASAGGPSYSETVGPMSDGIIEAPGPMEEFAVNSVKVISEVVDVKLGNMFEVSETSISLPSIQPNVEPDPCFRDITLQNIESESKPQESRFKFFFRSEGWRGICFSAKYPCTRVL
jgi:hypothetical protein